MNRTEIRPLTKTAAHPLWQRATLSLALAALGLNLLAGAAVRADDSKPAGGEELVPLAPKLPPPMFVGTPKDAPEGSNVEAPSDKPRPPLMIPKGVGNVAPGKKLTSSDTNATPSNLAKIIDGNKEPSDTTTVLLRKGTQYLQFDLGSAHEIFAIVIWHAHETPKIYRDVIVQVADDADFTKNLRTLFNNDADDSSKRGVGTDREYFETNEGKTIDAKGAKAQYVRLYSKGSTDSALNEYTEVEIYGRAPK
ncbi:MAG: discoidin protein [Pedosphaera sp.]|nr:discoidin protein [Pedosphaera sp.]